MKSSLIILALFAVSAFTQSCGNPMAEFVNITTLDTPSSDLSNIPYCKNLQTEGSTCCSTDTVNDLKDKVVAFKNWLTAIAVERDIVSVTTFNSSVNNITKAVADFQTVVKEYGDILPLKYKLKMATLGNTIGKSLDEVKSNLTSVKNTFISFQKARAKCFKTLLLIQASAYCLACDPEWDNRGVNSDGTINMGQNVCSRIQEGCYEFVDLQQQQNQLFFIQIFSQTLGQIKDTLEDFMTEIQDAKDSASNFNLNSLTDATKLKDMAENFDFSELDNLPSLGDIIGMKIKMNVGSKIYQKIAQRPNGCSSKGNCKWLCAHLLKRGALQVSNLAAGGDASDTSDSESDNDSKRLLADYEDRFLESTNEWDPSEDEANIEVTVLADPANVDDQVGDSASVITALVSGIMAILAVIFI